MQRDVGNVCFGNEGAQARVRINKHYVESEFKITTGLIEPHFMAGYSGGRKLVCPGIASAETILQFHSPYMIAHPAAHTGNLENNPVHLMSRAVAKKVGMDFICNVTLSEDRQVTGIFCGEMDAAHNAGIHHLDQQTKVPCEPADIVVTSAAGYPLDTTFYQSIKAMIGALPAVRLGGTIIVAASMSEGIGGVEFASMCRSLKSREEFVERIFAAENVIIDQWQIQKMMLALEKAEIMVVTDGVPHDFLRSCLLHPMNSLQEALAAAKATHGRNARVTVIPEGPYVTPVPIAAHTLSS
jgi:nickel-dependent lactate racemase